MFSNECKSLQALQTVYPKHYLPCIVFFAKPCLPALLSIKSQTSLTIAEWPWCKAPTRLPWHYSPPYLPDLKPLSKIIKEHLQPHPMGVIDCDQREHSANRSNPKHLPITISCTVSAWPPARVVFRVLNHPPPTSMPLLIYTSSSHIFFTLINSLWVGLILLELGVPSEDQILMFFALSSQ